MLNKLVTRFRVVRQYKREALPRFRINYASKRRGPAVEYVACQI
jgi:hypothetical protein